MRMGDNAKLRLFWKEQKFPLDTLSHKERLDNTAMDAYRAHLLAKAKGEETEKIPFIGYRKRVVQPRYQSESKIRGFGNTSYSPEENGGFECYGANNSAFKCVCL